MQRQSGRIFGLLGLVLVLAALAGPAAGGRLPLAKVADYPLTGGTGRFDYQAMDADHHRLFISHMGAGSVIAFDLENRRVIATLDGFPGATGITVAPALHRVFVSITGGLFNQLMGGGKVAAMDSDSLKTVWTTPAGRFPDGSALADGKLFVSDESGGQELVLDADSGKLIAGIPLGGEAGMTAFDPRGRLIYVNVQTRDELAAIDPQKNAVVATYRLTSDCDNNHGLLIEPSGERAFVACDGNAALLVFDLTKKAVTEHLKTGPEPDVLALDAAHGRLYVAGESGVVSVFDVAAQDSVSKIGEGVAGDDAHSIAVDQNNGLVYLPLRNVDGHPVLRVMRFVEP